MKKYSKLILIFTVATLLFTQHVLAGNLGRAPNFELKDLNENTFSLSSYKDKKPVILFFWTTWCPYCRQQLKVLNDMYPQFVKDGFELLAINIGEPRYLVDILTRKYSLIFTILLDRDYSVADGYDLLGVPTYVIIDKEGNIRFQGHQFPSKKYKELIS